MPSVNIHSLARRRMRSAEEKIALPKKNPAIFDSGARRRFQRPLVMPRRKLMQILAMMREGFEVNLSRNRDPKWFMRNISKQALELAKEYIKKGKIIYLPNIPVTIIKPIGIPQKGKGRQFESSQWEFRGGRVYEIEHSRQVYVLLPDGTKKVLMGGPNKGKQVLPSGQILHTD